MPVSLSVQVATGVLVASYWRGAWYVLDHTLFPNDRIASGVVSLACGSALLGMEQYIISPAYNGTKRLVRMLPPPTNVSLRTRYIQTNRFVMLYGIASACILIWRGTWLLQDEGAHYFADAFASLSSSLSRPTINQQQQQQQQPQQLAISPINSATMQAKPQVPHNTLVPSFLHGHENHHGESTVTDHEDVDEKVLFYSGIAGHVVATVGLLCMGRYASVMAPPANVCMLRDMFIHGKGKSFARAVKSFTHAH